MKNKKILIGAILAVILLPVISSWVPFSTVSNYQGIHPSFEAIYYDGVMYTSDDTQNASVCRIHPASFDFDPDKEQAGLPNLRGELRDIQIVRDLASYDVGDVASHILSIGGEATMPYKEYSWTINDGEMDHIYKMENWLCSMDVNLWADADDRPWWWFFQSYEQQGQYSETEIWLKLQVVPDWYFEGADEVYFGLGYMELALFSYREGHENPQVEIIPESKWAAFNIYNSLNGELENVGNPVSQTNSFEGVLLNPDVFRDEWYTLITVDDFGCFDYNVFDGSYNTDSVQLKVLVHTFVVGEWVVKPEVERDMDEHDSSTEDGWFTQLTNGFSDLRNNKVLMIYLAALPIIAMVLYFGPKWLKKKGES